MPTLIKPTFRQKLAAEHLIEAVKNKKPITGREIVEKAQYGTGLQHQPKRVLASVGVREALKDYGFTEENAKKVVAEILLSKRIKPDTRIRAASEVFKVQGSYAPEKSVNINAETSLKELSNEQLELLASKETSQDALERT